MRLNIADKETSFFFRMRKKNRDQLCNCNAAQGLGFHYMDNTIPLLVKSEISSF